jgi:hypothetical protein
LPSVSPILFLWDLIILSYYLILWLLSSDFVFIVSLGFNHPFLSLILWFLSSDLFLLFLWDLITLSFRSSDFISLGFDHPFLSFDSLAPLFRSVQTRKPLITDGNRYPLLSGIEILTNGYNPVTKIN